MVCVAASEKPERGKQDETLCGYQPPSQVSVGAPSAETDIARNAAGGGPGSDGEFWIPPLPQFKFRITPTGVEGGRLWSAQGAKRDRSDKRESERRREWNWGSRMQEV